MDTQVTKKQIKLLSTASLPQVLIAIEGQFIGVENQLNTLRSRIEGAKKNISKVTAEKGNPQALAAANEIVSITEELKKEKEAQLEVIQELIDCIRSEIEERKKRR